MTPRDKVRELKRDFVAQVFCGCGPFWEGVRAARIVQRVEAKVRVPPARLSRPRLSLSYPKGHPKRPAGNPKELRAWARRKRQSWNVSVGVVLQPVPQIYRQEPGWDRFAAALILNDPPEPAPDALEVLEEFAEYGGGGPYMAPPAGNLTESAGSRVDAMDEFYQGVIEEIGKRCFEPHGENVWQTVSDIYTETGLVERLQTRMREIETTKPQKNPGGRPTRDKLDAIKCAALYYHHNAPKPEDKRRRAWTPEGLVEHLGLDPAEKEREVDKDDPKEQERRRRIGRNYLRLGRKLYNERSQNRDT